MKLSKYIMIPTLLAAFGGGMIELRAADKKDKETKAYPLEKCVVSDEKLGEHGKPYVFTHKGQEVKLCCKSCLKDFKKDSDKYIKKIEAAQKK